MRTAGGRGPTERQPRPAPSRWAGWVAWGALAAVPLGVLLLFFVWPVVALVVTGLSGDVSGGSADPLAVLAEPRTWSVVGQTLTQATLGTVLSLLLGVPAAFVLYRLEFRGRTVLRGLVTVPFVLPTVVVAVAFAALFGPGSPLAWLGLDRSLAAIVFALTFFNVTVVVRTVGGFWAQLDGRAEEAARMLGAGPTRAWFTVTLPALLPALASAAALVFLFCATAFGIVLVLGGRQFANVETEIYRLAVQFLDLPGAAVLSLVQVVIVVLALVAAHLLRPRRERAAALAAPSRATRPVRRGDAPILALVAVIALALHAVPMGTLLVRSLQDAAGRFSLRNYAHLLNPPSGSRLTGTVLDAIGLSLVSATVATLLALLLGVSLALLVSRRPRHPALRRAAALVEGLAMLPLGVSAVTLGFGLLLTMHRPLGIGVDLRTSVVLIPIAQALVALPLVLRTLLPVLRGIDARLRDAAAMLGASPWRVLVTIDLALLARSLGLAVGFAFAIALGEFGATAFLVRPGSQTLPVAIAQLIGQQGADNYGMALAAAVVLGTLTATVMLIAERWRGTAATEW